MLAGWLGEKLEAPRLRGLVDQKDVKHRAKVQSGLWPVQRCKGQRKSYIYGSQVSADRVSGTGVLVRVRVRALNLYLMLNTRT